MNFLYVGFVSDTPQFSGILKKIVSQTNALRSEFKRCDYTYISGNNVVLNSNGNTNSKSFATDVRWKRQQELITANICEYIKEGNYSVIYIKGFITSPYYLKIAKTTKEHNPNCTVLFEVPTYPYKGEYKRFLKTAIRSKDIRAFLGHLYEICQHFITKRKFRKYVDRIVVFGAPITKLWGISAFTIENGISVENVKKRLYNKTDNEYTILGVAGTTVTHGFHRVINGLNDYYQNGGAEKIVFNIVGDNPTMEQLKQLVSGYNLDGNVKFLGYKTTEELQKLYSENTVAVSCLGAYLTGLQYLSPLKTREYCAAGIPFILAYDEFLIDEKTPFALKVANNDTSLDIELTLKFMDNCDEELSQKERQFAKDNYEWSKIMKDVLIKSDIIEEK